MQRELVAYWQTCEDRTLRQISGEFAAACVIIADDPIPEFTGAVDDFMRGVDTSCKVGALFSAAAGWREDDRQVRTRSHSLLLSLAPQADGFLAHAISGAVNHDNKFQPDELTRELLGAICRNPELLRTSVNMFFMRSLQGLLLYPGFEELVLEIAEATTALALASKEKTIGGLYDGELVGLSVTLQHSPTPIRGRAMAVYEQLLDAEVRGAEEAAAFALRR